MSHLRVIEVPLLLVLISVIYMNSGNINYCLTAMVYAIVRLFINIRFKIQQDKFQAAMLNHLDSIIDDMEE